MSTDAKNLLSKIKTGKAKIAVIGLGYVGLPLAHAFAAAGHKVTGVDVSSEKVALIRRGRSYIEDLPSSELKKMVKKGNLTAVTDYSVLAQMDAVIVCVPTP